MTYVLYMVFFVLVVMFQTTLAMYFSVIGGMYDLLLLFVIYVGFYRRVQEGFPFVVVFGLTMDALSGGPFGLYLTTYFWLYLCTLGMTRFMRVANSMILPFVVVGGILFENIIFLGTMTFLVPGVDIPTFSYRNVLIQIAWGIFTGPALLLGLQRLHTLLEKWMKTFQPEYR